MRVTCLLVAILLGLNGVIGSELRISNKAFTKLPRYKGVKELSVQQWKDTLTKPDKDKIKNNDWLRGIMGFSGLFIVLFTLNIVILIPWCICRCCCCGRRDDVTRKPTKKGLYFCWIMTIFMGIIAGIFGGMNYIATKQLSDHLLYNDKSNVMDTVSNTFKDASHELQSIAEKSKEIKQMIDDKMAEVDSILKNDVESVKDDYKALRDKIEKIKEDFSENYIQKPGSDELVRNPYARTDVDNVVAINADNIVTEMDKSTAPIIKDIDTQKESFMTEMIGKKADIDKHMKDFDRILLDSSDKMKQASDKKDKIDGKIKKYDKYRLWGYYVLSGIAILPVLIMTIGGIFKSSFLFSLSYKLLWFTGIIMSLLLALHFPGSIVISDLCIFGDKYDYDVNQLVPKSLENTDFTKVLQSCLSSDIVLADALDLRKHLEFTKNIQYPDYGNIGDKFKYESLDTFEDQLFTGEPFDTINNEYVMPRIREIETMKNELIIKTDNLVKKFSEEELIAPLTKEIQDMMDSANCHFIGKSYRTTKKIVCNNIGESNNMMVLCMLMMLIFGLMGCMVYMIILYFMYFEGILNVL